jgi:hypothetical protein
VNQEDTPEDWGLEPAKHEHYSKEVQDAIRKYYYSWARCYVDRRVNKLETVVRQQAVQDAFHKIVQLRRAETGISTYLTPDQYNKAIQSLKTSDNA